MGYLVFFFGILFALPILFLLYLLPGIRVSIVGILYLVGYSLAILGMLIAPWQPRYALLSFLIGTALLLITVLLRILFPPHGSQINLITLPGPSRPRLLNRILDEQDAVLFGAKLAPTIGFVSSREYQSLIPSLSEGYQNMHVQGVTPLSPFLTTYLGQQRPAQFDAILAEPSSGASGTGIIFLHGYGGNFTLQCWLIAEAGERVGAVTLCPSTDPSGQWWTDQGTAILQKSLDYFHQRGIQRIYLAGLSNGGIGASRLAGRFQGDLSGLILISGADPQAKITGLPVLLVHGQNDERIPASIAEAYAAAARPNSTVRLFQSDHFVLLKEADKLQNAIVDWLLGHGIP